MRRIYGDSSGGIGLIPFIIGFVILAICFTVGTAYYRIWMSDMCVDQSARLGLACMSGTEHMDEDKCECTNTNGFGVIQYNPW